MSKNTPFSVAEFLDRQAFPTFATITPKIGEPQYIAGLVGSATSALIAQKFHSQKQNILFLANDAKSAETMAEDLQTWLSEEEVLLFPGLDLKPYEWRRPFGHVLEQRLACYEALYKKRKSVVITTLANFLHRLSSPNSLHLEILTLQKGDTLEMDDFRSAVLHMGFTEENAVQDIGEFSVRGEIIDIYPYLLDNPIRLVLFGDEIESIKEFDIFTQRSVRDIAQVDIFPLDEACYSHKDLEQGLLDHIDRFQGEGAFEAESHRLLTKRDFEGMHWQKAFFKDLSFSLLDFLGEAPLLILEGFDEIETRLQKFWGSAQEGYLEANAKERWSCRPEELFFAKSDLDALFKKQKVIELGRLSWESPSCHTLQIEEQKRGGGGLEQAEDLFQDLHDEGVDIYLLSPNAGQAERLQKLTQDLPIAGIAIGHLSCGFIDRNDGIALLTDHQIFNRFSRQVKKKKQKGGGISIQNFEALSRGDFVVHQDYGVGRFVGIKRIKAGDHSVDCILLDYQGADKLALPVTDLSKLEKYASPEGKDVTLSKLGGKTWENIKDKAKKAVYKLAQELIDLYAKRTVIKGFAFSPDSPLQNDFEKAFPYELTPDQARAVADTKKDMESSKTMDRLICGDVGFGKTEVAMVAAFKAVLDKKQVCILAPTTILASQHYESFCERFSGWPVRIDYVNRFKSAKEQKQTLETLAAGQLDILIGTHRLISADVKFKDLGLMVIDEEQKFGVKQKERLKELRTEVDVLSMSATPIPRTLHMSLIGARDLSIIATPPRNRLPIETRVTFYDPPLIRDALDLELSRGGQIFFVHNRVADLPEMTTKVEEMVPHARVGMAHGQMDEVDLEQVMSAFVNREYDILVCTSIIESGIDIPNANTIIINRADLFGLSQLYQLRGRVGRSATKAYCLLIAPDANKFTDDAKKRLYSLQKFTDLGSGFQIAMRDLEIRGAGNILGLEQSGHIAIMGFETYCRMLQDAIKELQGQKMLPPLDPEIEFPENAFIPEEYVEDGFQRVALYQKLSRCTEGSQVDDMQQEFLDRFGKIPSPTQVLLDTMRVKLVAQILGFQKVNLNKNKLCLYYSEMYMPDKNGLSLLVPKFKRTMRFIYEKPLQILVELNGENNLQRIQQAVQVLRDLL